MQIKEQLVNYMEEQQVVELLLEVGMHMEKLQYLMMQD